MTLLLPEQSEDAKESISKRGSDQVGQEKNFENKVKGYLKKKGAYFIKYWGGSGASGKTFTKSGVPDLLVCLNGQFMGIEIKASSGKPSELQIYNLGKIHNANGLAVLLFPDDFEQFTELVECVQKYGHGARGMECYTVMMEKWKHFEIKFKERKE